MIALQKYLHRYWIEFDLTEYSHKVPYGLNFGCGVTAFDQDDAFELVSKALFDDAPIPPIKSITVDVNLSALDQHVLPNIGNPVFRGIWFPPGYG